MKIEGPNSAGKLSSAKKTAKSAKPAGAGFARALDQTSGEDGQADEAPALAGGAALASVDALLALQGVEDVDATNPDGRRRNQAAARRGEDLLDQLDEIRVALLTGRLPESRLRALSRSLAARGETAADPKLKGVLDDIELRVAVELAKYDTRP
jgi:hypothetical protein